MRGFLRRILAPWRDRSRARELRKLRHETRWENPPCAICGGASFSAHYVYNGFRIVRCDADGLIFVSPRPVDLAPFYDERYYTGRMPGLYSDYGEHARSMTGDWTQRLESIETHAGRKGRLLDVGAATGDFLDLARGRGWKVAGVEPSEWASAKAREEKGLDITTRTLENAGFDPESFGAVTLWDSIEHMSDPAGTLRAAARVLEPGGILAISTGAVPHLDRELSSGWYYPPWHLYYFSPETLGEMCARAGFEIVETRMTDESTPYALMTLIARRS
jgi:hypothetical protein